MGLFQFHFFSSSNYHELGARTVHLAFHAEAHRTGLALIWVYCFVSQPPPHRTAVMAHRKCEDKCIDLLQFAREETFRFAPRLESQRGLSGGAECVSALTTSRTAVGGCWEPGYLEML